MINKSPDCVCLCVRPSGADSSQPQAPGSLPRRDGLDQIPMAPITATIARRIPKIRPSSASGPGLSHGESLANAFTFLQPSLLVTRCNQGFCPSDHRTLDRSAIGDKVCECVEQLSCEANRLGATNAREHTRDNGEDSHKTLDRAVNPGEKIKLITTFPNADRFSSHLYFCEILLIHPRILPNPGVREEAARLSRVLLTRFSQCRESGRGAGRPPKKIRASEADSRQGSVGGGGGETRLWNRIE
ncbi:hypothetical protein J6590_072330 [Homalodisca vitripennis]|nr:hypothetical protein J6590_072330 [Homalodisca vitripennis]